MWKPSAMVICRRMPSFCVVSARKTLMEKCGHLNAQDKETFLQAGFGADHLLEVIAIVAASTITNYTAGVTQLPLEADFQAHA